VKIFSHTKFKALDQNGFTLIELISVLIILGVLASVAVKRFDLFSEAADMTVLRNGVKELNTREIVVWSKIKLSDSGYSNDLAVYNAVDKSIGPGYSWDTGPEITGGTLRCKSQSVVLTRTPSDVNSIGYWK